MARTAPHREHPVYGEIVDLFISYENPLEEVSFAPLFDRHLKVLSVSGRLSVFVGRDLTITAWSGGKEGPVPAGEKPEVWVRIEVAHDGPTESKTFRAGDEVPLEDEEEEVHAAAGVAMLVDLLTVALPSHENLTGAALVRGYLQLNAACADGAQEWEEAEFEMFGSIPLDDEDDGEGHSHAAHPHGRGWYDDVDAFTDQCRYGFLHQLAVQESPRGGGDVSALIKPPGMTEYLPVKVFLHQGELETEPGHWYSAGEAMCPAHGKDVDVVGLVAGFPVESQAFIAHSLEHLHTISHLVTDILQSRAEDILELLERIVDDEEELISAGRAIFSSALADTFAGLNGIARLHTGAAEPLNDEASAPDHAQG